MNYTVWNAHAARPMRPLISRWVRCHQAHAVTRSLLECATKTLSSLYLAVSKDALYAGSEADRQPVLYVLDQALQTLTSVLAPILPHLAEEIAWYRQGATKDPTPDEQSMMPSVFQRGWHTVDEAWHDPAMEHDMQQVLRVRSDVFALMTQCIEQQYVYPYLQADTSVPPPKRTSTYGSTQPMRCMHDLPMRPCSPVARWPLCWV